MYTFKYEDDNVIIEVKTKENVVTLNSLLSTFEDFLRASGFNWIDSIQHVGSSGEIPSTQSSDDGQKQIDLFGKYVPARGLNAD